MVWNPKFTLISSIDSFVRTLWLFIAIRVIFVFIFSLFQNEWTNKWLLFSLNISNKFIFSNRFAKLLFVIKLLRKNITYFSILKKDISTQILWTYFYFILLFVKCFIIFIPRILKLRHFVSRLKLLIKFQIYSILFWTNTYFWTSTTNIHYNE